MGTKRSLVQFLHDEGYEPDLVGYINSAIRGKDMIAEKAHVGDMKEIEELKAAAIDLLKEIYFHVDIDSVTVDRLLKATRTSVNELRGKQ